MTALEHDIDDHGIFPLSPMTIVDTRSNTVTLSAQTLKGVYDSRKETAATLGGTLTFKTIGR